MLEVTRRIGGLDQVDAAGRFDRAARPWGLLALVGFWGSAALLTGTVAHLAGRAAPAQLSWARALVPFLAASAVWVPLTLAIATAARRYPPVSTGGEVRVHARNAALHGLGSLGVTFVLNAGWFLLLRPGLLAEPAAFLSEVARAGLLHLHLNAGVYWVVVLGAIALPALIERRRASAASLAQEATLTVRSGRSTVRVRVSEIRWIEGAGDYVCLHLPDSEHLLSQRMKELEASLDPERFVRVHRSAIVNVAAVERLRHVGHGDYEVRLDDGSTVRVARSRRERFLELLEAREVGVGGPV